MTTSTPEERNKRTVELLPALKDHLKADCNGVDDEYLLMFLRWKPNVARAAGRYRSFLTWKRDNPGLFDDSLRISKDPELERLLQTEVIVEIPGLVTKEGGPLLIGRLRNNDMTDGRTHRETCRMLFYTIDRVLMRQESQVYGVTVLHDLRASIGRRTLVSQLPRRCFAAYWATFPFESKPFIFGTRHGFSLHCFPSSATWLYQRRYENECIFIDDLKEIEHVTDPQSLLVELGGKLEWSAKDWVNDNKQKEIEGTMHTMTSIEPAANTKS
jgi:hypothetical protein